MEFTDAGFAGLDISRLGIWEKTIKLIANEPLWGYGASTFPFIFNFHTSFWKGHAHNLPLEIAFNFGIPAALAIFFPIVLIIYFSTKKIFFYKNNNNEYYFNDRAFITSLLILSLSQLVDIQYYDGRISLAFWIMLAGARNIIRSKEK